MPPSPPTCRYAHAHPSTVHSRRDPSGRAPWAVRHGELGDGRLGGRHGERGRGLRCERGRGLLSGCGRASSVHGFALCDFLGAGSGCTCRSIVGTRSRRDDNAPSAGLPQTSLHVTCNGCHVTKKGSTNTINGNDIAINGKILFYRDPLPPDDTGQGRIEPDGRHADVADRSNNFCRHVRDPCSNHSRLEHRLALPGGL